MAKLTIEELKSALKRLPDWKLADGREAITRKFQFVDFDAAFSFMTRAALKPRRWTIIPSGSMSITRWM